MLLEANTTQSYLASLFPEGREAVGGLLEECLLDEFEEAITTDSDERAKFKSSPVILKLEWYAVSWESYMFESSRFIVMRVCMDSRFGRYALIFGVNGLLGTPGMLGLGRYGIYWFGLDKFEFAGIVPLSAWSIGRYTLISGADSLASIPGMAWLKTVWNLLVWIG
ncbi:hypothetical protein Nepgr_032337 [Nepenthes gracilis]|uniref:Uncharacterized protein n=1 Tax=Nepenthes gracilis TaxID=150966 RepID=A0AAD3Y7T4_NEPGR|nr:hypothetical protein Nepgr_032337 [Nepenthes gracilis]